MGLRNRGENAVLPERCGIRTNKFGALHTHGANALLVFGHLKSAENSPWQSLVPRELYLPATRSLSRYCLDSYTLYLFAAWTPTMQASSKSRNIFFDML